MENKRRGIILLNLGSPDSTSEKDLKKYLGEFLMDGRVIDYPYIFRKILVEWIIVPSRAAKSAEAYRTIWTDQGSPLIVISRKLQEALSAELRQPVGLAMRYGNPDMESAFEFLRQGIPDLEEVVAIPLYPHYAMSSYETAVEHARKVHRARGYSFSLSFLRPYYNELPYIVALADRIRPYLGKEYDHLLFSFHGIPERHLIKTDPTGNHCLRSEDCCRVSSAAHGRCYRHQCLETMERVAASLNIPKEKYSFSFQSRLGRAQWLRPYTDIRLTQMPGEGIRKLLIVCPAFVSDCLETLEEIEIRGKESFLAAGGTSFAMIPCLNDSALWVKALAGWFRDYAEGKRDMILE